ncbi:hypothetical protein [Aquabacterium humicola]|uniref:hypothetical protein n=1 Tax=Aquabacterium humicola TaxID=3237377 RepID=UPI002543867F|nr:hypothetical protein [Rubrivivax pictus]
MSFRSRWRRSRRPPQLPRLLRWASRIEAWPPVTWLILQCIALLPASPVVATLLAAGVAGAQWRGRLGCDWAARLHWLALAAALTLLAHARGDWLGPAATALLAAAAVAAAWLGFRAAERGLRRTTRRLAEQALARVQLGAAGKCAYALALVASCAGALR